MSTHTMEDLIAENERLRTVLHEMHHVGAQLQSATSWHPGLNEISKREMMDAFNVVARKSISIFAGTEIHWE